jgi:dihydrofolate reductase
MRRLGVFNNITLDGYFTDSNGDIGGAYAGPDPEFDAFVADNAKGGGALVLGRKTYDMMAAYWPTPEANRNGR